MDRRRFVQATGLAAVGAMLAKPRLLQAANSSSIATNSRVTHHWSADSGDILLAGPTGVATILIDQQDHQVVYIAGRMLADNLHRITGHKLAVVTRVDHIATAIIIGTLGQSRWVDQLAAKGKINVAAIKGKWEASLWQTVEQPIVGIDRALVIVGSDRRGTAYGVMDLCELAGVSPWFWWADVPVNKSEAVAVTAGVRHGGEPGVKYRGIFINDEDWGFQPWAAKTFDPQLGNVGPKTYQKVFDLMLRLKLNYLWPAMHNCSTPFAAIPENSVLANDYAIVMGSSHVEPMLANPVSFLNGKNARKNGPWNFVTNSKNILKFWTHSVESRGKYEAIWTIGMRGPYDSPLEGVHTLAQERSLVQKIFGIQRALLERYVTRRWGSIAQCYVPYKEALLVYNSGLKVPGDVTIIWPDNNFGYIRQFSNTEQRKHSGGAGVYYHIEYLGGPHSYCWLNTTPPALMWEELKKAWDNDSRTVWVINVGGIKPREIGMDFAARLAWNPKAFGADAQRQFLRTFAAKVCGAEHADAIAAMLREFYRLGQMRKPESMDRFWAAKLPLVEVEKMLAAYHDLLKTQEHLSRQVPESSRAAFFELFGYPAQMLAATGFIFLYDRLAHTDVAARAAHENAVAHWRAFIEHQVAWYNDTLEHGKWRHYATMGGTTWDISWAAVQWPWLHNQSDRHLPSPDAVPLLTIAANDFKRSTATATAAWHRVEGLGWSAGAMALWPALPTNQWNPETQLAEAPRMEYHLTVPTPCADGEVILQVLPTYELYPGMQLRIAISWNDHSPQILAVPFASNETRVVGNAIRSAGVLDNHIPLRFAVGPIAARIHKLVVHAVDPGIVLDQINVKEA
ncbi:MAG: glycosyl hydrolase 115 family protein [Phycisphaerae bacterium]